MALGWADDCVAIEKKCAVILQLRRVVTSQVGLFIQATVKLEKAEPDQQQASVSARKDFLPHQITEATLHRSQQFEVLASTSLRWIGQH